MCVEFRTLSVFIVIVRVSKCQCDLGGTPYKEPYCNGYRDMDRRDRKIYRGEDHSLIHHKGEDG